MNCLEVVELTKVFRGPQAETRAVDHVSFTVRIGETLGLIGESGCGKSTLAYCIARLIQPTSGSVFLDRKDWLQLEGAPLRSLRQRIQLVFQDPYTSLNPHMRIGNILEEPLIVHKIGSGEERRIRVQEMLSNVGLEPHHIHRRADEFSGGQRQRIAIARALMTQPALLIADEPLSSLDSTTQSRILDLFGRLKEQYSLSLLFISHNLEAVHQISDRIAIMHCGKLVEIGNCEAIFETARHPYTRFLLESAVVPDADRLPEGVPPYVPCDLKEIGPDHWAAV